MARCMSENALGKASSDSTDNDKDSLVTCPTCGRDDFKSERGMKQHHAMSHGKSLTKKKVTCETCGSEFRKKKLQCERDDNNFCSTGCYYEHKDESITKECEWCGSGFEVPPSRSHYKTCSNECGGKTMSKNLGGTTYYDHECGHCGVVFKNQREDARYCSKECVGKSQENKVHLECDWCEEALRKVESQVHKHNFCSIGCNAKWKSEYLVGEDNPLYIDGSNKYRGENWDGQREKALNRDNYTCQYCGVDHSKPRWGLSVHHIIPFRRFDDYKEANELSNLVSLCQSCHMKWEGLCLRPDTR